MTNLERRLEFHDKLCDAAGSSNVYFQPPETIKMSYPCIIYQRSMNDVKYADNDCYIRRNRYSVTVVDKDPDSSICDKIERFKYCQFDRYYSADNLNHFVYTIYY